MPRGIAGDMKPFADPYVTFKLSKVMSDLVCSTECRLVIHCMKLNRKSVYCTFAIITFLVSNVKSEPSLILSLSLGQGANGTFGPQPQRSSFRKHSLSPRWGPPEKFMFVVDESTIASGKWPGLLVEVVFMKTRMKKNPSLCSKGNWEPLILNIPTPLNFLDLNRIQISFLMRKYPHHFCVHCMSGHELRFGEGQTYG